VGTNIVYDPSPSRIDLNTLTPALLRTLHPHRAPARAAPGPCREVERWTLRDVAAVLVREGYVCQASLESIRRLLQSRKHSWQRAKEWLRSPDPQ
jgi:hypothetical protein